MRLKGRKTEYVTYGKRFDRNKGIDHKIFSNRNDFTSCYFAGVLYGDGCTSKNGVSEFIQLSLKDYDVVENLAKFVGLSKGDCNWHSDLNEDNHRSPTKILKLTSDKMVEDLKYFGVVERKTYVTDYGYPENIDDRGYILGLYDSDGTVYFMDTISFYGNKVFAWSLNQKLNNLGFETSCKEKLNKKENVTQPLYQVRIRKESLSDFIMWLLDPNNTPNIYSERKFLRVLLNVCYHKVIYDKNWMKCWKAKLREQYVNQQPSQIIKGLKKHEKRLLVPLDIISCLEGSETILNRSKSVRNLHFEASSSNLKRKYTKYNKDNFNRYTFVNKLDDDIVRFPVKAGLSLGMG